MNNQPWNWIISHRASTLSILPPPLPQTANCLFSSWFLARETTTTIFSFAAIYRRVGYGLTSIPLLINTRSYFFTACKACVSMLQFIHEKTSQSSALVSLTRLPTSWIKPKQRKNLFQDTNVWCEVINMKKKLEKSNDHHKKRYIYNTAVMRLGTSLNPLSIYRCN